MNYFQNEAHFINYIRKICKERFGVYITYDEIKVFKILYKTNEYKTLFNTFNLGIPFEKVTWELKYLDNTRKAFKEFYDHKVLLLFEIANFIENPKDINTEKCKILFDYCYNKLWKIDKSINRKVELLDREDISKETFSILGKLYKIPGVYFLHNKNKSLIYIGKSYDLSARIIISTKERGASFFRYMITKTKVDADIIEPYMIGLLKPIKNGQYLNDECPSFKIQIPKISRLIEIRKCKKEKANNEIRRTEKSTTSRNTFKHIKK